MHKIIHRKTGLPFITDFCGNSHTGMHRHSRDQKTLHSENYNLMTFHFKFLGKAWDQCRNSSLVGYMNHVLASSLHLDHASNAVTCRKTVTCNNDAIHSSGQKYTDEVSYETYSIENISSSTLLSRLNEQRLDAPKVASLHSRRLEMALNKEKTVLVQFQYRRECGERTSLEHHRNTDFDPHEHYNL